MRNMEKIPNVRLTAPSVATALACLAVLQPSLVSSAHAQATEDDPIRGHVQLDTFFYGGDASRSFGLTDVFNWANLLSGGVDFGEWGGTLWVPFAHGEGRNGVISASGFMLGNIALEGFYDLAIEQNMQLRLLARLGLPTSTAGTDVGTAITAGMSGGVTFWDPRYWPSGLVTPGIAAELTLLDDAYVLHAMGTADVLIGTESGTGSWSNEVHFTTQALADFSFRLARVVHVGLRAMAGLTWTRLRDGDDADGLAFEPFVGTDPELDFPLYGRLGVILNVDHGLGPTFEPGRVWAVHLTVGVNIE
jgi:hypothetical protein